MNMTEYLASGHRRCKCNNVILTVKSYEHKTEKLYSQNAIKNLILSATLGIRYNKPVRRWKAVCTQCDKYYLFGDTKKELLQKLNKCGIPFISKVNKQTSANSCFISAGKSSTTDANSCFVSPSAGKSSTNNGI